MRRACSCLLVLLHNSADGLKPPASATSRRTAITTGAAALTTAAVTTSPANAVADNSPERQYGPLLQGPFDFPAASRATLRREIIPGRIWSFEQVQGFIYVHIPVRMSVVKLDSGGLFVYAPIGPTDECLRLLSEIEAEHGPVKHILLPTLALEHKSFAGAFAGKRPNAQLWVADAQYSFPINLPLPLTGLPANTKRLPSTPEGMSEVPWADQLPYRVLGPLYEPRPPPFNVGGFQEVACYDTVTKTLLVTDTVISIPSNPPEIVALNDKRALLYHSRDEPTDVVVDTPEARRVGWQKIALFACYFQSSPLLVPVEPDGSLGTTRRFIEEAFYKDMPPSMRELGWNGFFAWRWNRPGKPSWPASFAALQNEGKPVVPPILQEVVLSREPDNVLAFAQEVANAFPFTSILPAHFEYMPQATPKQWLDAFRPFGPTGTNYPGALPDGDLAFLRKFEETLMAQGTIRPRPKRG